MNSYEERMKLVKAMEFIARHLNDETILNHWLQDGPGDGEIKYGDLDVDHLNLHSDIPDYYCGAELWSKPEADKHIAQLMNTFLWCMYKAYKDDSGLVCENVSNMSFRD